MLASSSLGRHAQRALRCQCSRNLVQKRGLAAPASGTFQYQTGDSKGIKFASRDLAGPTTTLGLVSRAGTRYQPVPGLSEGLERFAFHVCTDKIAGKTDGAMRWLIGMTRPQTDDLRSA